MEGKGIRRFKMGDVRFEDLLPGDIVEGFTEDSRLVTFEALEGIIENEELIEGVAPRAGVAEFGVNLSGNNILVYTTSTGTTIAGTLYPKECFVFTGATSGSRYEIELVNPQGSWVKGWYIGTDGMSYWKNRYQYYGMITVTGSAAFKARVYAVEKSTGIYHSDKTPMGKGTLYNGDYVFVESDQCYPGSTERDWMRVRGFTYNSNPSYSGIYSSCDSYGSWYGYADTQVKHAPRTPAIRGNW